MKNRTLFNDVPNTAHCALTVPTRLRDEKDHFVVTIYKDTRRKTDLSVGNVVILELNHQELIRPINEDFHLSLPKKLLADKKHGDELRLSILKIVKRGDKRRAAHAFSEKKLCLSHFVPIKTTLGYPLYIIERDTMTSYIWYPVGGGVRHVILHNFIDITKIGEFLGFYFGDGTTCKGIQSLRLTNCELSILNYCLDFCEEIGILRTWWKVQVIYSTNGEITHEIKQRCINYWSNILRIRHSRIVSVTKSKNVRETTVYGSARLFIDNTVLVEVFLHGLLSGVLKRITHP